MQYLVGTYLCMFVLYICSTYKPMINTHCMRNSPIFFVRLVFNHLHIITWNFTRVKGCLDMYNKDKWVYETKHWRLGCWKKKSMHLGIYIHTYICMYACVVCMYNSKQIYAWMFERTNKYLFRWFLKSAMFNCCFESVGR